MGLFSNLLNKKNTYHRTMSGIRVYDWQKSMDRKNPYKLSIGFYAPELVEDIIKDMVVDKIKKAIINKISYSNLLGTISVSPQMRETLEIVEDKIPSFVFSMEIETIKYRVLILVLPMEPSGPVSFLDSLRNTIENFENINPDDNAVHISIEPNEIPLDMQCISALEFMVSFMKCQRP